MKRTTCIAIMIIIFSTDSGIGDESCKRAIRLKVNDVGEAFIVDTCDQLSHSKSSSDAACQESLTRTTCRSTSTCAFPAAAQAKDRVGPSFHAMFPPQTTKRRCCRSKPDCDCDTVYASFNVGTSHTNGRSGGTGTIEIVDVGVFEFGNGGAPHDEQYLLGGAIGKHIPFCMDDRQMTLRAEVEAMDRRDLHFVTNSFPGVVPAAPTPRFYNVDVDDVWTVSGNLWLDIPVDDNIDVYTGFGLGVSGFQASVTDTVVSGFSTNTEFSYRIGAGINLHLTHDVVLDFGWRFVDLGEANVNLSTIAGAVPAGNYELDLHSNEFIVAVRIDLF